MFEKQQKNYNIISVQPKEYQDTIKMFPKYHLENDDSHYYKKMQLEKELTQKLLHNKQELRKPMPNPELPAVSNTLPEVPRKAMRGKYLNNVD